MEKIQPTWKRRAVVILAYVPLMLWSIGIGIIMGVLGNHGHMSGVWK